MGVNSRNNVNIIEKYRIIRSPLLYFSLSYVGCPEPSIQMGLPINLCSLNEFVIVKTFLVEMRLAAGDIENFRGPQRIPDFDGGT